MKIDDLLDIAGDDPIEGFTWGTVVLAIINPYMSNRRKLTGDQTGTQIRNTLHLLALPALTEILQTDVNVNSGAVNALPISATPSTSPTYQPTLPYELSSIKASSEPNKKALDQTGRRTLIAMLVGTMIVIALMFAVTIARNSWKNESNINSTTMETVIRILGNALGVVSKEPMPDQPAYPNDPYEPPNRYYPPDSTPPPADNPRPVDDRYTPQYQ